MAEEDPIINPSSNNPLEVLPAIYKEQPLSPEIANMESKHLAGMMAHLKQLVVNFKRDLLAEDNLEVKYDPATESYEVRDSVFKKVDNPVGGVGLGRVIAQRQTTGEGLELLQSKLGFNFRDSLVVYVHTDADTNTQAEDYWEKYKQYNRAHFMTQFIFTPEGNYAVLSVLPSSIKTDAEPLFPVLPITKSDPDPPKMIKSDFTMSKAELAGSVLGTLIRRVQRVSLKED